MGFFNGFLILCCLFLPFLSFFGMQDRLDAGWLLSSLKQEFTEKINQEGSEFQEDEEKIYSDYANAVKGQISRLGDRYLIRVKKVDLSWDRDDQTIRELVIEGETLGEEKPADKESFLFAVSGIYQLDPDRIQISLTE